MKTIFLTIAFYFGASVVINTIFFIIIKFLEHLEKEPKKSKNVKETIILYKDGTWELYDQEEQNDKLR